VGSLPFGSKRVEIMGSSFCSSTLIGIVVTHPPQAKTNPPVARPFCPETIYGSGTLIRPYSVIPISCGLECIGMDWDEF
jgi:hypothetical protein